MKKTRGILPSQKFALVQHVARYFNVLLSSFCPVLRIVCVIQSFEGIS
jgi:hypothetical protein